MDGGETASATIALTKREMALIGHRERGTARSQIGAAPIVPCVASLALTTVNDRSPRQTPPKASLGSLRARGSVLFTGHDEVPSPPRYRFPSISLYLVS